MRNGMPPPAPSKAERDEMSIEEKKEEFRKLREWGEGSRRKYALLNGLLYAAAGILFATILIAMTKG